MSVRREQPHVWVSWLPNIMLGDRVCHWGVWLRSNYKDIARKAPDVGLAVWTTEHAKLVGRLAETLTGARRGVSRENEDSFTVHRSSGLAVGGKPGIVSWDDDGKYTVYDVKTGVANEAHVIQVML